ncbi:hypothetical protein HDU98_006890 [Podochytrium sp. JEL0797]|nr:hypothetical protein HDU98_006890 [Podochytrium sp. JEL0797]
MLHTARASNPAVPAFRITNGDLMDVKAVTNMLACICSEQIVAKSETCIVAVPQNEEGFARIHNTCLNGGITLPNGTLLRVVFSPRSNHFTILGCTPADFKVAKGRLWDVAGGNVSVATETHVVVGSVSDQGLARIKNANANDGISVNGVRLILEFTTTNHPTASAAEPAAAAAAPAPVPAPTLTEGDDMDAFVAAFSSFGQEPVTRSREEHVFAQAQQQMEADRLDRLLRAANAEIQALQAVIESKERALKTSTDMWFAARQDCVQAVETRDRATAEFTRVQAENEALANDNSSFRALNEVLFASGNEQHARHMETASEKNRLQHEIHQLRQQFERLRAEAAEISARKAEVDDLNAQMREEGSRIFRECVDLSAQVTRLNGDLTASRAEIGRVAADGDSRVYSLHIQLGDARKSIESLTREYRSNLRDADAGIERLNAELATASGSLAEEMHGREAVVSELNRVQASHQEACARIEDLTQELAAKEERVVQLETENQSVRGSESSLRRELESVLTELTEAKERIASCEADLHASESRQSPASSEATTQTPNQCEKSKEGTIQVVGDADESGLGVLLDGDGGSRLDVDSTGEAVEKPGPAVDPVRGENGKDVENGEIGSGDAATEQSRIQGSGHDGDGGAVGSGESADSAEGVSKTCVESASEDGEKAGEEVTTGDGEKESEKDDEKDCIESEEVEQQEVGGEDEEKRV